MRHSRAGGNPYAPNFAYLAETLEFMDPRLRGDDDMKERIRFFQQPARANNRKSESLPFGSRRLRACRECVSSTSVGLISRLRLSIGSNLRLKQTVQI